MFYLFVSSLFIYLFIWNSVKFEVFHKNKKKKKMASVFTMEFRDAVVQFCLRRLSNAVRTSAVFRWRSLALHFLLWCTVTSDQIRMMSEGGLFIGTSWTLLLFCWVWCASSSKDISRDFQKWYEMSFLTWIFFFPLKNIFQLSFPYFLFVVVEIRYFLPTELCVVSVLSSDP